MEQGPEGQAGLRTRLTDSGTAHKVPFSID